MLLSNMRTFILLALSILWCELGYYHFVLFKYCYDWPGAEYDVNLSDRQTTRMLVIADTHIMGPRKSSIFDKLLREWQMQQAFRIANNYYKPDVIVFLGDQLDEGSISSDEMFESACAEFDSIFPHDPESQDRIVLPGNHDVGFHDRMVYFPQLLTRLKDRQNATTSIDLVRLPRLRNLNIIAINSMTFYEDTCPFCSYSRHATDKLANLLDLKRRQSPENFSLPIIFKHIPLFRRNDSNCIHSTSMAEKVHEDNIEGKDVLHKSTSLQILTKLKPRLVISGHTHMECQTLHKTAPDSSIVKELTVSSFNHKYAMNNPQFLLLNINSTHIYTKSCNLTNEWVIATIYAITLLIFLIRQTV